MAAQSKLDNEIDRLKKQLESVAAKHKYNFRHPQVLAVSQKLDGLIVQQMKNNAG